LAVLSRCGEGNAFTLYRSPGLALASYGVLMAVPDQQVVSVQTRHVKLTRYFRAIALTASTADLMTMSLRLAEHFERLAKAGAHGDVSFESAER
jgi:hypothetical protein